MKIKGLIAGALALAGFMQVCAAQTYKITVAGGYLDDETTSRVVSAGDSVEAYVDWSKLHDKNENEVNAFAKWTYTPATADLGEDFNPFSDEVRVTMPSANVKLTANFVNGFAGYIYVDEEYELIGEAEEGEFYWSVDNGKTLIPLGREYPVKAGKVTVKFYDKTGNWRAAWEQTFNIPKRATYKEGRDTYYDDPFFVELSAKFVPVNASTKVKFDTNGGSGSYEAYLANGYEYGSLPLAYRKDCAFAGWWTEKNGGVHVTQDAIFDPSAFPGQATPTLYAHWMSYKKLTMKDDAATVEWCLSGENFESDPELLDEIMCSIDLFDLPYDEGGSMNGKGTIEVLSGANVSVSVPEETDGLVFQKWSVTPSKVDLGSGFRVTMAETEFIMPSENVTLQANYVDESACGWISATVYADSINVGYDIDSEDDIYISPPYGGFEWSPDGGKTWYKAHVYDGNKEDDYYGEDAMVKPGTYTITWRSSDPRWTTYADKMQVTLHEPSGEVEAVALFTYVPQIVVDVVTVKDGDLIPSTTCGTATMNPKDGLLPAGKTATLTAKAAKGYAFQGWVFKDRWGYYSSFDSPQSSWKLENNFVNMCGSTSCELCYHIDPSDLKVHIEAVFKALSDYSIDDIEFYGFTNSSGAYEVSEGTVVFDAVVGCAVENYLECGMDAYPLTYKLTGKLPDGLKLDAKSGAITGSPKKAGTYTFKISAIDPAKHSKDLTVTINVGALPTWIAGDYRGFMNEGGLLEMSVKADGKVSAKVITRIGTRSVSGTLEWLDPEINDSDSQFRFWHEDKDDSWCHVKFMKSADSGTVGISGIADSYDKATGDYVGGEMSGLRQNTLMMSNEDLCCGMKPSFPLEKYYTFAFSLNEGSDCSEELGQLGYGYLTIKTDKKGGAKVTGQLPDGQKVSMSALVMPYYPYENGGWMPESEYDTLSDTSRAALFLFNSPSAYKKEDWFSAVLTIDSDGKVVSDFATWTYAIKMLDYEYYMYGDGKYCEVENNIYGFGAEYSAANSLEDYYWYASCEYSEKVVQEVTSKEGPYIVTGNVKAVDFDGYFFNVALKGDSKGSIALESKSPAPWKNGIEWNYWEDKKGDEITDPSQMSISFAKATGIFSGKASVYFDYAEGEMKMQHKAVSIPYAGVMIKDEDEESLMGYGSAQYTYKWTWVDECTYKATPVTSIVSLPVVITAD